MKKILNLVKKFLIIIFAAACVIYAIIALAWEGIMYIINYCIVDPILGPSRKEVKKQLNFAEHLRGVQSEIGYHKDNPNEKEGNIKG